MCAICGFVAPQKSTKHIEIFSRLLAEGQVRGTDATGEAHIVGGAKPLIRYYKKAVNADAFIKDSKYKSLMEKDCPTVMIGHDRATTQGPASNNLNNHPQVDELGLALVHNGTITNDHAIFEKFGLPREAQVDSEVLVRLIAYYKIQGKSTIDAIKETMGQVRGGAAIALLALDDPGAIYLAASTSPLHVAYQKSSGALFFASTRAMLEEATQEYRMILGFFREKVENADDFIIQELEDNTGLRISTERIDGFSFTRPAWERKKNDWKDDKANATNSSYTYPYKYGFNKLERIKRPKEYSTVQLETRLDHLQENIFKTKKEHAEVEMLKIAIAERDASRLSSKHALPPLN